MAEYTINARGLQCPTPIIRLFMKIKEAQPGDLLTIEVTDIGFKKDVDAWCAKTKNELVWLREEGELITAQIRKTG